MNLRLSFKKRSFYSPSSIGRAFNWTYTRLRIARILNWAKSQILYSFALLSRFKFEAFPRTYDLPTAFLNWPSIQLNIHRTENCANTELGWKWDFMLFPSHCSVNSSSKLPTNIRSPYNASQLTEHPIEHTHDWELREHWIRLRARFLIFFLARLSRFKFGTLPRIYDLPTALPQLAEHPIEYIHDWELREY